MALALVIFVSAVDDDNLFQDAARGFERTDVSAYASVGGQLLMATLVGPTFFLGGRLQAALMAQLLAGTIVLGLVWRFIPTSNLVPLSSRRTTLTGAAPRRCAVSVLRYCAGAPARIDAAFLSALAPS